MLNYPKNPRICEVHVQFENHTIHDRLYLRQMIGRLSSGSEHDRTHDREWQNYPENRKPSLRPDLAISSNSRSNIAETIGSVSSPLSSTAASTLSSRSLQASFPDIERASKRASKLASEEGEEGVPGAACWNPRSLTYPTPQPARDQAPATATHSLLSRSLPLRARSSRTHPLLSFFLTTVPPSCRATSLSSPSHCLFPTPSSSALQARLPYTLRCFFTA